MALPIIPLAVGAGLLALLALTQKKAPAPGAAAPTSPGGVAPTAPPPPTPGAQPMPPQLKAQFDDLLANGLNADGLEQVAGEMEKFGFLNEGATLRARAAQLRAAAAANAAAQVTPASTTPPPFVPGVIDTPRIPSIPAVVPLTPPAPPTPATPAVIRAKVTTNDPPPSGDLIMRDEPSDSAAQVPGGGAEKDGIVQVLDMNASPDGVWAMIIWPGGDRRPAAQGFAKKKFLQVIPPSPVTSGIVIGAAGPRYAKCAAPSGCRLRLAPNTAATFRAIVGNGEAVQVLRHAQGTKADMGSPGPGGWALVKYKNLTGWLPSEWLAAA